jgi:hypothetical protein
MTTIRASLAVLCLTVLLSTLTVGQGNSSMDRRAARKASDAFMADLVANRISNAIEKTEHPDPKVALSQFALMLDGCGRPIESKIANDGSPVPGDEVQSDGTKKSTLNFLYTFKSERHSDWVFYVEVWLADDAKYHVHSWGCHAASK